MGLAAVEKQVVEFARLEAYDNELAELAEDFLRARGLRLSPKTLRNYRQALEQFVAFQVAEGRSTDIPRTDTALRRTRRDVEAFTAQLIERTSKVTAATRLAALKQFYRWAAHPDERVIPSDPIATLDPPTPDVVMPEIITKAEQDKLLKTVERDASFEGTRDAAIIRILLGTGCRLNELVSMKLSDISPDHRRIRVMGKSRRERDLFLPPNAVVALDRYLRARRRHAHAHLELLWLGSTGKGPLSDNGVVQMLRRRSKAAKIRQLHPHLFRHTWRHEAQMAGISDDALMTAGGWRTRQMLDRYGASGRTERAALEFERWSKQA